jgi:transposase
MRLTYRYRPYPSKAQEERFDEWLESLRLLYNSALVERQDVYEANKRSVSVYEQKRVLPDLNVGSLSMRIYTLRCYRMLFFARTERSSVSSQVEDIHVLRPGSVTVLSPILKVRPFESAKAVRR